MKTWGTGGIAPSFWTLVLDGSDQASATLLPGKEHSSDMRLVEPQGRSRRYGDETKLAPSGMELLPFSP
jgi:hypothetical protein